MTLKEKLRAAEDNSEGARSLKNPKDSLKFAERTSFTVGGLRYARCRICGELWNISKTLRLRGNGYQCPKCYYRGREDKSNV